MLSKQQKISRSEFPKRNEQKKTWNGQALRVLSYKGAKEKTPVFAIIISKKQSDGAVMRNRFKRAVYGAIRRHFGGFINLPEQKFVIFPSRHLRVIKNKEINEDIVAFLGMAQEK